MPLNFPIFPEQASSMAGQVDALYLFLGPKARRQRVGKHGKQQSQHEPTRNRGAEEDDPVGKAG